MGGKDYQDYIVLVNIVGQPVIDMAEMVKKKSLMVAKRSFQ